jgi:ketosteroid isomerase-like protein
MSRENLESGASVALGRGLLEAISARDLPRLIALTDPEVEWHSFFAVLGMEGAYRGHAGLRQYVSDLEEAFEVLDAELYEGLAVGEVAVLVGRIHYRGKGSGVETEMQAGWTLRYRNGRLISFQAFGEPEKVLASVGRAR